MAGFTVTQLDAIEKAIASGTLKVRYDGKEIQYQDLPSLMNARKLIREELIESGMLQPARRQGQSTVTQFSRD